MANPEKKQQQKKTFGLLSLLDVVHLLRAFVLHHGLRGGFGSGWFGGRHAGCMTVPGSAMTMAMRTVTSKRCNFSTGRWWCCFGDSKVMLWYV